MIYIQNHKKKRNLLITIFIASTIFLVVLLYTAYQYYAVPPSINVATSTNDGTAVSNSLTPPSTVSQVANQTSVPQPALPVRLIIPSIHVDAAVEQLGLAPDKSVDVPKGPYDVAWFDLGPRPGEQGSAVISGHFGPWLNGAHSVFDNLNQVKPGDSIMVKTADGTIITFVAKSSKTYSPTASAPEVFTRTDGKYLNLITCGGDWIQAKKTFTQRLVVFAQAAQ